MRRFLLSVSALCLLSPSAYAGEELKGRAEANWRYGSERAILMTEFWVPFMQDETSVLYGDLRMMGDDQDNREGNLGVGYRKITEFAGYKGIAGVHGWLDRRLTARGSAFHQTTLGAEWLGESVDVLANGYIPLSNERTITIPNANPQGPALVGTGIVVDTNGQILEEPQHGFDIELGWELGQSLDFIKDNTDSFRIYGGGYYFDGDNTERVTGWRTRFTADISSDIQIGARFQRDDERGSQGFLEATVRFPFGQKKSYRQEGLRARLDESPERDIDIVTGDVVTDSGDRVQVLNQATGQAQEVLHVDNTAPGGGDGSAESPFNTLAAAEAAASAHTIIYVKRGDGTSTNQDQGIALDKTGQQLIGTGTDFIYDSGRFTTANGASPTSILIAPASAAPVITNVNAASDGVSVTADNVTVAGIIVDGATRDGIVVEADGGAASAQNVSITDVSAINNRIGIYIHGANGGSVSARVQGSVATTNSQHGMAVYDDTNGSFSADLGGGSMGSAGNNVLAGNTLEDLAVELDGGTLQAQNNWWGQASGPDTDTPDIGIAPQIYYGAPINDGLVGHWTFDTEWTTNTTAYDRSGQGNDGTLQGGLSLADSVAGQNRQALDFDGVDDFINAGNSSSLNFGAGNFSIALKFKILDTSSSFEQLLSKHTAPGNPGGAGKGYQIASHSTASGNIRTYYRAVAASHLADGPVGFNVRDGNWYTYSFIADNLNSLTTTNINGSVRTVANGLAGNTDTAQNLVIGAGSNGALNIPAVIDDTRIYNRALSASEIAELHRMDTSSAVNTSNFLTAAP